MGRRTLQLANATVALATIGLAGMQLTLGVGSPVYSQLDLPSVPVLDSNLRFFGGMGLGLGVLLLWILPTIERRTGLYRLFWFCAFLGGLGRAISILIVGWPPAFIVAITVLEVVGAPLFVYWHNQLASPDSITAPRGPYRATRRGDQVLSRTPATRDSDSAPKPGQG
jgi:hypothetical protein